MKILDAIKDLFTNNRIKGCTCCMNRDCFCDCHYPAICCQIHNKEARAKLPEDVRKKLEDTNG